MDHSHYLQSLYPLQDRILALINELDLPLYLTGGTALSRHYLFHRYSDDLDLFVNAHAEFRSLIDAIDACFREHQIDYRTLTRSKDFVRLEIITSDATTLKLDLVNDLACHFGECEYSPVLGKVDNVFNILSNKISALPKLETKDFADLIFISHKYRFNWETMINEAFAKDSWVNPLDLAKYFFDLNEKRFEQILWIIPVNITELGKSCRSIARDIVQGSDNSLVDKQYIPDA